MRLTTRTRYGTRAMLDLALHYGQGPLTSTEIAYSQDLSVKYLESILTELRNAGLIHSQRGAQGGHLLGRPPAEINLLQIFQVLEGTQGLVECTSTPGLCQRSGDCLTQHVWSEMYAACQAVLEAKTLQDMVDRHGERHSPPQASLAANA